MTAIGKLLSNTSLVKLQTIDTVRGTGNAKAKNIVVKNNMKTWEIEKEKRTKKVIVKAIATPENIDALIVQIGSTIVRNFKNSSRKESIWTLLEVVERDVKVILHPFITKGLVTIESVKK